MIFRSNREFSFRQLIVMKSLIQKPFAFYPLLTALLLVSFVVSITIGVASIPVADVFRSALIGLPWVGPRMGEVDSTFLTIVRDIRLPRAILGLLVGAALASSGAVMQGFFRNPMADPFIVGISAGAALGATVAFVLKLDVYFAGLGAVPIAAFVGAMGAIFLVYGLSVRGGQIPVGLLLLTGVAVSALTTAIVSLMMIMGDENPRTIMFWLMGSLSSRAWIHVWMMIPYFVVGMVISLFFARDLNILLLGEESARHLGVEVERVKRVLLIAAALLASSSVAAGGIIGFVGLIVPHVTRIIVGPDHRRLIAASALSGGALVLLADTVARIVAAPGEVPIGIITALIGCPFFLFLLARRKETGW